MVLEHEEKNNKNLITRDILGRENYNKNNERSYY